LTIESIEPTPLFPRGQELRQLAWLKIDNRGPACGNCRLRVEIAGKSAPVQGVRLPAGISSQRFLVPDIQSPAELVVELLDADGHSLASRRQAWTPQRRWKIFVVHSSHEDLGYEDFIFRKQKDIADYIDLAHRLSGPASAASSYHYTLETLLFMRNYIEERSEQAWRALLESDIRTGRMPLMGAPSGVHTQWMDYEELVRATYEARREVKDRFGLDLKTFMLIDNPSVSWSACQVLADAGFKYVARWGQSWRTGGNNNYATTKLPAVFWWVGPNGKSRVLYTWRSHYHLPLWYGQDYWSATEGVETAAQELSKKLKEVEDGKSLGPYPYDALITPEYMDHEIPHFQSNYLAAWNNAYQFPEIQVAGPDTFFEHIERHWADKIPTLSGELNNFSGDYSSIDPDSQGWKRRASRLLPFAEGLSTIAGAFDPGFLYPAHLIDRTYKRFYDYDEHSWPTQPRANDFHMFNAQWVKQREGERALVGAREAVKTGFTALARLIRNAGGRKIVLFNPLAHERTAIATTPDGKQTFVAENVPAFGYRVYDPTTIGVTGKPARDLKVSSDSLENDYYRLTFDANTGAIRSLFDKELERELIDPHAPQQFNQLVYLHTTARESAEGEFYSPKSAKLRPGAVGSLNAQFTTTIDDPKTGAAITQTVTLWTRVKRIDITNRIEHAKALYSDRYEDRYRDNIYFAFPIDVPNGQARAECAGGVVRPHEDQLRWGSHDYLNVNRWADVSNDDFGVTMVPEEASAVSFGEIRYNRFSIDYKPSRPYLFSFAWSNRMAGLLTLEPADCNQTLHYSFTSHRGGWNAGTATRFGWETATPLETAVIEGPQTGPLPADRASFVKIGQANVQLVTLKNSEQPGLGWIARIVETEGRDTDATLEFPNFDIASAEECDLVENARKPVATEGNRVRLRIGKYDFTTIRLTARGDLPRTPSGVTSQPMSDSEIALSWPAVPAAAAYNVYRSVDPDDPASAYTLFGRTTQNRFLDKGLSVDTAYHYRVAAVNRGNLQSAPSPPITARTTNVNRTPPGEVEDLGIVRRSKDTLIVYWRRRPEPDVARYLVYRGKTPEIPATAKPIATVEATRYFLQILRDTGLEPGQTYYYKVLAEDWAGNRQSKSPVTHAATSRGN
jgi:hypothetical protein